MSIERICEYLHVNDLISLTSAIFQWNWILELKETIEKFRRLMSSWMWFDKNMCELLLKR
ncbi:unnamed protein product [Hymenolepis diminuta]|uniref:F-box domain-containing protein n=1 Tax=Hymenolepis diminuta TaxID=6216 RepID=A0A564ZAQ5_HYMDI|nr:unnamed protein product [Hymenolepis diminuta]